jgi:hypothetical protein
MVGESPRAAKTGRRARGIRRSGNEPGECATHRLAEPERPKRAPRGEGEGGTMSIPSSKFFVIVGFTISLASVGINTFVLANLSARLKAVDSEHSRLDDALRKQIAQLNEADLKFDVYRVMHHLASATPAAAAKGAREDAQEILKGFLVKFHAAANDIPPIDVTRVAMEEAGEVLPRLMKSLDVMQALQRSKDPAERARLAAVLEKLEKEEPPPTSELAAKLRAVGQNAEAERTSADGIELTAKLFPVMKSITERLAASIKTKEARLRELELQRSQWERRAAYASYAAISLQIFGLMFLFTRDILREIVKTQG